MNSQHRGRRRRALGGAAGVALAAAVSAVCAAPRAAEARVVQDERYAVELTWNAALRLLRVDMGFTITERDREAGFILFTYQDAGRSTPGSVEIVPARVDGVAGCRIIVQLPQMPTYAERHILTQLGRKLRAEYGEPPAPARPAPPAQGGGNNDPADGGTPPPANGGSTSGAARPGEGGAGPQRPPDGRG